MFYNRKVYHVRPVTQGDVIRADAKDIPRIFQVIMVPIVTPVIENTLNVLFHYRELVVILIKLFN
jgi:hypothetical protein